MGALSNDSVTIVFQHYPINNILPKEKEEYCDSNESRSLVFI